MNKVSIAINVIMGLAIVFLFKLYFNSNNRIQVVYTYLERRNQSILLNNKRKGYVDDISDVMKKIHDIEYDLNGFGSPFKIDSVEECLFNTLAQFDNYKDQPAKFRTQYKFQFDTLNFNYYQWNPRLKNWMKINEAVNTDVLNLIKVFHDKEESHKILKPNEDPNTAKDLRERK